MLLSAQCKPQDKHRHSSSEQCMQAKACARKYVCSASGRDAHILYISCQQACILGKPPSGMHVYLVSPPNPGYKPAASIRNTCAEFAHTKSIDHPTNLCGDKHFCLEIAQSWQVKVLYTHFTTLGWSSSRSNEISRRALLGTPSSCIANVLER